MLELRRALPFLAFPILAFVLAVVVTGCADIPNPLPTPVAPDALHPARPMAAAPTPPPDPNKVDEVDRQQARWAQTGIDTYRMTMAVGCFCNLGGGDPIEVRVVDGQVTEASVDGRPLQATELEAYPLTVDALFDYANRFAGADKLELKYDERLGYPTALGIDPNFNADDDEIRVVVTELVPGR